MESKMKPPLQSWILGAFRVNKQPPFPWPRALGAGVSAAIPIVVGLAFGNLSYGLLATMGGFTYLYSHSEPYARRGVKLLTVMFGLAFCLAAGSLSSAASFWCAALVLGLIGAAALFVCEALDVGPPSALFFILTCALGTSMPAVDPSFILRAGLIFLGGIPAWLLAMLGWLFDPRGPETEAVAGTYRSLATWLATVGTEHLDAAQHKAAAALRASERALSGSGIPKWRPGSYARLVRLNEQAGAIFLAIIALTAESRDPVDPKLAAAMRALADAVDDPDRASSLTIPEPERQTAAVEHLYDELTAAVAIAADERTGPVQVGQARRGTIRTVLVGALDPNSLILPKAVRFGSVLSIAYLIAHFLGTQRPDWVVLSTGAVMMGPSVTATLHRSVQRTVGTILGVLLGVGILAVNPAGVLVALVAMLFQVLAQLMIVRNYALTVAFVTPIGFLIAHSGHPQWSTEYLVRARLFDTLLGCALGLAGTLLFGRRASSKRLPAVLSDVIRAEGRLLDSLLANQGKEEGADRNHLRTSLLKLRVIYDAAVNELDRARSVESLWPAVVAVQRLGFFLIALTDYQRRQRISKASLAELRRVFDALAFDVEAGQPPQADSTPLIPEYPVISQELHEISQGLQVLRGRAR